MIFENKFNLIRFRATSENKKKHERRKNVERDSGEISSKILEWFSTFSRIVI